MERQVLGRGRVVAQNDRCLQGTSSSSSAHLPNLAGQSPATPPPSPPLAPRHTAADGPRLQAALASLGLLSAEDVLLQLCSHFRNPISGEPSISPSSSSATPRQSTPLTRPTGSPPVPAPRAPPVAAWSFAPSRSQVSCLECRTCICTGTA